jgi:hypothetical protein
MCLSVRFEKRRRNAQALAGECESVRVRVCANCGEVGASEASVQNQIHLTNTIQSTESNLESTTFHATQPPRRSDPNSNTGERAVDVMHD